MKPTLPHTALLFLMLFAVTACTGSLEEKVRSYEDAHNRHDIDRVMSMYTDDIRFEVAGSFVRKGREQVRGIAQWDLATDSQMFISDIEVRNDTAFFKLKEGNDWFRSIGIDYMHYQPCLMIFEDGLIRELKVEVTDKSREAFSRAWPEVYRWLMQEKKEELAQLTTSEGEFVYNKENARRWLTLLEEWKKSN